MKYKHVKLGLSFLNFALLQWFTLRLMGSMDKLEGGGNYRNQPVTGWVLLYGIVPFSGWWTPFKTYRSNSHVRGYTGVVPGQVALWKIKTGGDGISLYEPKRTSRP